MATSSCEILPAAACRFLEPNDEPLRKQPYVMEMQEMVLFASLFIFVFAFVGQDAMGVRDLKYRHFISILRYCYLETRTKLNLDITTEETRKLRISSDIPGINLPVRDCKLYVSMIRTDPDIWLQ